MPLHVEAHVGELLRCAHNIVKPVCAFLSMEGSENAKEISPISLTLALYMYECNVEVKL